MKILHVAHNFYPVTGGMEKNIEDICRGLKELGHQSDVCCNRLPGTAKSEVRNGIRIHRMRSLNLKFYKISPCAARLAKRYDVVHVHGIGFLSDYMGLTKPLHGKPLVLSTHGGVFHTRRLHALKKAYFYLWSRLPLKLFDRVVAVSESDRKMFSRVRHGVEMIPDTVSYDVLSGIRRRPEKGVFVYVGRLSPNKRLDNLLRAFSHVAKSEPRSMLFIIGGDWQGMRARLERLAKQLGTGRNVVFTGRLDDENVRHYFERAQFFVSASEYEGFGISVLEAMAAGIPVIVNNIDAFRTFIENGKSGFMIDYSDPREAARRITNIMKKADLAAVSGNAKRAARSYDYRGVAKRFEKLYQEVASTS